MKLGRVPRCVAVYSTLAAIETTVLYCMKEALNSFMNGMESEPIPSTRLFEGHCPRKEDELKLKDDERLVCLEVDVKLRK